MGLLTYKVSSAYSKIMEEEILEKLKAGQAKAALKRGRDELGRFIKSNIKVSQNITKDNLRSQNQDQTLIDIKLNNPLSTLFRTVLKSFTRNSSITIRYPSIITIILGSLVFGLGGFVLGRQTIDLSTLFIQKNGQPLDPNQYVNRNVVVTGRLNPDKKTFSLFTINTVGP